LITKGLGPDHLIITKGMGGTGPTTGGSGRRIKGPQIPAHKELQYFVRSPVRFRHQRVIDMNSKILNRGIVMFEYSSSILQHNIMRDFDYIAHVHANREVRHLITGKLNHDRLRNILTAI